MARPRALTRKWSRDRVREHRQREKDRKVFMAGLFQDAPDGFGQRVRFRFEHSADGVPVVTINLPDQECADHVNRFAASVGVAPDTVLEAFAKEAGRRLVNGDFQVSKGADSGSS